MISLRTIEEVRQVPVNEVIAAFGVELKRSGAGYTGCCPFHNEKTPSFHVTPAKGFYKCFGCGVSGDGIKFVMEKTGKEFTDAVTAIAEKHSITIELEKLPEEVKARIDANKALMKLLQKTQAKYEQQLQTAIETNPQLKEYIYHQRKLKPETLVEWGIGYAPEWDTIANIVKERGALVDATKAGVVHSGNSKSYDTFHHRLIVPINNVQGQTVSFGGRALPWGEFQNPKYINGNDTPVYNKRQHLFGLSKALPHLHKSKHAILVEGYFDCITQHQIGNNTTVASLGTALTEEQAKLLRRYASHVTIMRDGDKAGRAAAVKDIDVLAAEGFAVSMIILPEGEDPDSYPYQPAYGISEKHIEDAIQWRLLQFFEDVKSPNQVIVAVRNTVEWLLDKEVEDLELDVYVQNISSRCHVKPKLFQDELKRQKKEREEEERQQDQERSSLPAWVSGEVKEQLFEVGFVQLHEFKKPNYHPGIYFGYSREDFKRLTNYTVKPLYFIMDPGNERRLIEINNGKREAVIELGKKSMIEQGAFETDIATRPGFFSMPGFSKIQYKTLANWINSSTRTVYELTALGWQNEGFFAFSNKILHNGHTIGYDDYGIVTVNERSFLSPGVSKLQMDIREDDNIYENDLYLKYEQSPINLKDYLALFHEVYEDDGRFGIAFIFITAFLDIVGSVTKRPIFYSFGPKDSGKSALCESIMWFFFSGKNSEGKLIQGYNLNPGQGTHFSFFSRAKRFQNCPMLFNEYDPFAIEPWKKGAFKSYYDGEGREVGSGDTGKKRKTEVQKWKCSAMIVGQYLDTGDEAAVVSRSIISRFSMEKNKNRTDAQKARWKELSEYELQGVSSLVADLFKFRPHVKAELRKNFWELQPKLNRHFKEEYNMVLEARLLNNYTLCLAMIKTLENQLELPFTYEEFERSTHRRLKLHQELMRDNSILNSFWRDVEVLFDDKVLLSGYHLKVSEDSSISLKQAEGLIEKMENLGYRSQESTDRDVVLFFPRTMRKKFLYIRFDGIYDKYSKRLKDKTGKQASNPDTLLAYLKDQSYFLGLAKGVYFKDKTTSAYVLDYDALGVNLERTSLSSSSEDAPEEISGEELPFKASGAA